MNICSRHPWFFERRRDVLVQGHLCPDCGRMYADQLVAAVRANWCPREAHRQAVGSI